MDKPMIFHFQNHNYDVIFLQETYSTITDSNIWLTEWGGKMFLSYGSNHSRG